EILSQEKILEIEKLTQNGGAQIVALLKSGSAYYAPASSVTRMVEAILQDQKCVLPVCAYVEAAYGIKGLYFGVPAALGKNGVERVIEIAISESERATLQLSAQKVAAGILELEAMMGAAKKL
ncbi:MAG: malate dehydrogenase, partial [Candidatus Omnitrophota bacterium]